MYVLNVSVQSAESGLREYQFSKSSVMVGRAEANDVALISDEVSRYHARLDFDGEHVSIQDLGSTNGILVDNQNTTNAVLTPESVVGIGEFVIRVKAVLDANAFQESIDLSDGGNKDSSTVAFGVDARSLSEEVVNPLDDFRFKGSHVDGSCVDAKQGDTKQCDAEQAKIPEHSMDGFYWESLENFLKPIWSYVNDDTVSEILINGESEVYIERRGHLEKIEVRLTKAQLDAAVLNIAQYVGRRISTEEPYLDARLPDGSRVAVLLHPCSRKGTAVAIRKFSKEKLTLDKLVEFGTLSADMVVFLRACVLLKKNILISGGTSSGKTSLLNVVSSLIPSDERIVTIEDSAELQLSQEHVLPMETRPPDKKGRGQVTIRDLVRVSLRMRPDRVVVGEIRGGEAIDLLQAMNTGHSGSMATLHASSPIQSLSRLETLALFSGLDIPIRALREQVSSAIDIVIQASRLPDHSRKVTHISEICLLAEDGSYRVTDIFQFKRTGKDGDRIIGEHIWTGKVPELIEQAELAGLSDVVELFGNAKS